MKKRAVKSPKRTTAASRLKHRLRCVSLVLKGTSAREVARAGGDSFGAVASWVRRFKAHGADGLKEARRSGRPPSLGARQMKRVQEFVLKARAKSRPVTGRGLAAHIRETYGVTLTERQCARIVKRMTV